MVVTPTNRMNLTPAVPAVFGVEPVAIEPVPLPPGGYYPALRPEVRKTFLEHANERVVELMQELSASEKSHRRRCEESRIGKAHCRRIILT